MSIFDIKQKSWLTIAVAAAIGLGGCGDKETDQVLESSMQSQQNYSISAQDLLVSTGFHATYKVDLSNKVSATHGADFQLTDVDVLSKNDKCKIQSITKSAFIVQASEAMVCDYRYYVQATQPNTKDEAGLNNRSLSISTDDMNSVVSTSAIGRVAVSAEPDSTVLTPLSTATLVDTAITFNIEEALLNVGYVLGENYDLVELTLPFPMAGSVQQPLLNDRVIYYTPAVGYTGIDRIMYSFEDSTNRLVLMGSIDIAIGYHANQGLIVEKNGILDAVVNVNDPVDINISQFVTSNDSDDYQLVDVSVFNATAVSKAPDDTSNKVITFVANKAGAYHVSFVVSDHNGAYEMGLFLVEVTDLNQSARWLGINLGVDYFTPPPTALDALGSGVPYASVAVDSGYVPAIEMALYSLPYAKRYCTSQNGSLTTPAQMDALRTDTDVSSEHGWPIQSPYLAYDPVSDTFKSYQMPSGPITSVVSGSVFYVTCIKQGVIEVLAQSDTDAIADGIDTAVVNVKISLSGKPVEGALVSARANSNYVSFTDETVTELDGIASFSLTTFKADLIELTVSYNGIKTAHTIDFIGDEKTAGLTSKATENFAFYNSDIGNQVTAKLEDENLNPLVGYIVEFDVYRETHPDTLERVLPMLNDENELTDINGEKKVRITWDPQYVTPNSNMTFDVIASYKNSIGDTVRSLSKITFNVPPQTISDEE
ncbi:hypothetical protein QF117_03955 [Vibrio sp. YMD68]|uniref:Ig-like domain-containing protein n=1 Tax=Vibrio sp. YMD68 TaxID=3042300 RepID=UPI00249CA7A2|nr:hypothetical protein [Vibrio sp. YMD68]WGV98021.1 hypothetical protein QF117_03955 [Vibrio sp. YMD68]